MRYDLPTSAIVNGKEYAIRSDYRAILDIIAALSDLELDNENRLLEALDCFYPDFDEMPTADYEDAIKQCFLFINCGEDDEASKRQPKLMDWEQDFPLIIAPVNRILGKEIRAVEYLHWYTFIAAYQEIGDCTFAQVVGIRRKKLKGKRMDDAEREFYKQNHKIVDFKRTYTDAENDEIKKWL